MRALNDRHGDHFTALIDDRTELVELAIDYSAREQLRGMLANCPAKTIDEKTMVIADRWCENCATHPLICGLQALLC